MRAIGLKLLTGNSCWRRWKWNQVGTTLWQSADSCHSCSAYNDRMGSLSLLYRFRSNVHLLPSLAELSNNGLTLYHRTDQPRPAAQPPRDARPPVFPPLSRSRKRCETDAVSLPDCLHASGTVKETVIVKLQLFGSLFNQKCPEMTHLWQKPLGRRQQKLLHKQKCFAGRA